MSFGIRDHVQQVRALLEEAASAYEGDPDARPEEAPGLVLGELESLGDELRGLMRSDVEWFLEAWVQGRPNGARHIYLANRASYDERRAAAAAADADSLEADAARRESWGRIETVLRGLGTAGVRLALALLRA